MITSTRSSDGFCGRINKLLKTLASVRKVTEALVIFAISDFDQKEHTLTASNLGVNVLRRTCPAGPRQTPPVRGIWGRGNASKVDRTILEKAIATWKRPLDKPCLILLGWRLCQGEGFESRDLPPTITTACRRPFNQRMRDDDKADRR